jgi:hypothetical protein
MKKNLFLFAFAIFAILLLGQHSAKAQTPVLANEDSTCPAATKKFLFFEAFGDAGTTTPTVGNYTAVSRQNGVILPGDAITYYPSWDYCQGGAYNFDDNPPSPADPIHNPGDGSSIIRNTTAGSVDASNNPVTNQFGTWFADLKNHTSGSGTGYMMIVNGTNVQRSLTNPGCANLFGGPWVTPEPRIPIIYSLVFSTGESTVATYVYFSFWAINVLDPNIAANTSINPEIQLNVYINNVAQETIYTTGDIAMDGEWHHYGFWIMMPSNQPIPAGSSVRVDMVDYQGSSSTAGGNDFAIDNIQAFSSPAPDILPVNFGSVNASLNNKLLTVNWSTLTETNNNGFDVEASADGNHFTKINSEMIKSKAADGNATAVTNYSFTKDATGLSSLLAAATLAFAFAIGFAKRKRKWQILVVGVVFGMFALGIACNKNNDKAISGKENKLFIRIKQIDKDGGATYSKIVQAVNVN